ncbi:DUF2490 domain-containing protein [Nitrosomonas supralitoralis]|uniref:DUF2490 domain-containing protein n=1 Tax=Nitrosomonas supralitoralis TaxID=2116706 RepID=A0A2P7NVQ7_9PROT|nr:DUF2490 domain-containing protein [Nitrosomonas supralitoralis]PSJ17557.1 DUF2490 domain-containing protein [Nitrosomonas supralitoralis]
MLKKVNVFILLATLILVLTRPASAEEIVQDFQFWGNITATGNFGFVNPENADLKKFKWWAEGQGRFGNDASQFTQSLIRPGVGYALNDKIVVWAGYAWAPTCEPIQRVGCFNEHRLWQQVTWADNFSFGRLSMRSRFEERFFDDRVPDPGPNNVAYRFRQLVKLVVPMPSISPNLGFVVADELFIAMNTPHAGWITEGFDQNRGFVGLAYKVNQVATVEMGYMNQLINRAHNTRPDQMMHNFIATLLLNF